MNLVHCIYSSAATNNFSPTDLAALLTECREKNLKAGLTGMLLYGDRTFLADIPGLNDFFARGRSYTELGEGRAKTLLSAFKEGAWRHSLT